LFGGGIMESYFTGIATLLVLKSRYRELCKIFHPDLGGDLETMKAINNQYEMALRRVHDHKGETLNDDAIKIEKDLMEIINKIVALKGIMIEVTGRWIWVTGETKQYKDVFKALGMFWASKKFAWYWRPRDAKSWSRKSMPFDHIRSKYGSINIDMVDREALA
jgi:hypothetical protein